MVDVLRPAVFLDPGRFPDGRAVDFLAIDPCHINPGLGAGRENAPGRCDCFGRRGRAAAMSGKDDVSETAAAAIENDVFDFAHILAA